MVHKVVLQPTSAAQVRPKVRASYSSNPMLMSAVVDIQSSGNSNSSSKKVDEKVNEN